MMTSTNTPSFLPALPALDNTFGAYLLGTFLGMLQYGVLLYQVQEYCRLYPRDRGVLKCLVAAIVLLETVFSILNIHTCYHYLVLNYFAPPRLLFGVWSINFTPLASAMTVVVAQSFFARRVFLVGRRYRSIALIAVLLFVAIIALDAAGTAQAFLVKEFSKSGKVTWLAAAGSITASVADLLLTAVLIVALRRSRTGFKHTDSLIAVITMYTINTGLLTGIFHVLLWIVSIKYPENLIYGLIGIINTRLYGNVLLATLNARISFSKRGMHTFGVITADLPETSMEFRPGGFQSGDTMPRDVIELKSWNKSQGGVGANDVNNISSLKASGRSMGVDDSESEGRTAAISTFDRVLLSVKSSLWRLMKDMAHQDKGVFNCIRQVIVNEGKFGFL
ncbi:hypothetical protein OH76DRAFT_1473831 [Lentinus brumalis]|uniref:DUF6534 domain-containing protein n=1 Tax=Lentinus brumalis TaxID=2498619 RepID=A0A371CZD6_9APHY|nr:hypothetical protein OH76DRAFT_1473831 [Polyporus brumalis]